MTVYNEWVDFVTFPLDLDRVQTKEQRLDVSNAVYADSEEYKLGHGDEKGFVITLDRITFDGDEFEAMEVIEWGAVTIWTRKKVWTLHRDRGLEKLFRIKRHPDLI